MGPCGGGAAVPPGTCLPGVRGPGPEAARGWGRELRSGPGLREDAVPRRPVPVWGGTAAPVTTGVMGGSVLSDAAAGVGASAGLFPESGSALWGVRSAAVLCWLLLVSAPLHPPSPTAKGPGGECLVCCYRAHLHVAGTT